MKTITAKVQWPCIINFLNTLENICINLEEDFGFNAEAVLGQISVETNWLENVLPGSNNLGNIKQGAGWTGEVKQYLVPEYDPDHTRFSVWYPPPAHWSKDYVSVYQPFRVYASYKESINDYCNLITTHQDYTEAYNNRGNAELYLNALQKAGYAGAPDYAQIILNRIRDCFVIGEI